jgi:hypothetical protein
MIATLNAVNFGGVRFFILISAISVVVALLFVAETIRNRAWIHSTMFDYRDLKSLVVETSLCGSGNAELVEKRPAIRGRHSWVGDSADTVMGKVKAGLESEHGTLAIRLSGGGDEGEILLERYTQRSESGEQLLTKAPSMTES